MNWQISSSSQSSMVMTGGTSASCPRTFVFFRLMVSRKSLQACEKQSIMTAVPPGCGLQPESLDIERVHFRRAILDLEQVAPLVDGGGGGSSER